MSSEKRVVYGVMGTCGTFRQRSSLGTAQAELRRYDTIYPNRAPHRAVRLVEMTEAEQHEWEAWQAYLNPAEVVPVVPHEQVKAEHNPPCQGTYGKLPPRPTPASERESAEAVAERHIFYNGVISGLQASPNGELTQWTFSCSCSLGINDSILEQRKILAAIITADRAATDKIIAAKDAEIQRWRDKARAIELDRDRIHATYVGQQELAAARAPIAALTPAAKGGE